MNYSFTLLTSKEDCDMMIAMANKSKSALNYRKLTLLHKQEISTGNAVEIETALQSVNSEIAAVTTVIAALPEGDSKKEQVSKKTRLEFKLFTLTERKESYGILSLLDTEFDIGCIEKDIEQADAFIAGVNDRKSAL